MTEIITQKMKDKVLEFAGWRKAENLVTYTDEFWIDTSGIGGLVRKPDPVKLDFLSDHVWPKLGVDCFQAAKVKEGWGFSMWYRVGNDEADEGAEAPTLDESAFLATYKAIMTVKRSGK